NAEKAWNFFKSKGLSDAATAGILGNLEQESGLDPSKHQLNGGLGRGIMQWEKGGGRYEELVAYAAKKGTEWDDLQTQLEFAWLEMTGKSNDTYGYHLMQTQYGGFDNFKNLTDARKAADIFEGAYERAGEPVMGNRYAAADKFLSEFGGSGAVGGSSAEFIPEDYGAAGGSTASLDPSIYEFSVNESETKSKQKIQQILREHNIKSNTINKHGVTGSIDNSTTNKKINNNE